MGIFINAFLWRQTQDFTIIGLYNLLIYVAVPLGFYINGFLFTYFSTNSLYVFSLLLRILLVSILIFLPQITYPIIIVFGLLEGLVVGMYWANRNILTLKATQSHDRIYFSSLESISETFTAITIPFVIGWFIILGTFLQLYTPQTAYKLLSLAMLAVTGVVWFVMTSFKVEFKKLTHLFITNAGTSWNKFRLLQLILGFADGTRSFIPALMVLLLIGNEGALGTVQSFAAILSAVVVYFLAKSLQTKHRLILLQISFVIGILGATFFGLYYSALGVIVFFACQALTTPFNWVALQSLNYDLIDEEKNQEKHYAYVCDQEIYLNGGRVLAIIGFLWLVHSFSSDTALRFSPIIFAFSQLFLLLLAKSLERKT
jgi:YQGE family putative transporter